MLSLMTWANKHTEGSTVSAYTVLQPVTAAILCFIITKDGKPLATPALKDLGIVPIALGLLLVVFGDKYLCSCGRKKDADDGKAPLMVNDRGYGGAGDRA